MVDFLSAEYINSLNLNVSQLTVTEPPGNETSGNRSGEQDLSHTNQYEKVLLNYYLMGVGGMAVCCIGVICNILSIIVLTRRVMNSSTYSYLTSLAVCDLLVLILSIFLFSEDTKYPERGKLMWAEPVYAYLFPYVHPATVTLQVTSVWLTMAFTVDRYIMICHPFDAEKMCKVSRARKVIVGIFIFGAIFNIPRFLEYKTKKISLPTMDGLVEQRYIVNFTKIGSSKLFLDLVHSYFYLTCVCGIPFLTLSILNIILINAVHRSRRTGKQINVRDKKRNDTTVMLIGVIVIFLLCQGPALISRMVYAIDFHYATTSMTFHIINEVGNFLVIVNSAINIVPYYLFGKRFRTEFWTLFCKCFFNKQELRRITRNLSFSIDNRRRQSQLSQLSFHEVNGYCRGNGSGGTRDSFASPLIDCSHYERSDVTPPQYANENSESGDGSSPNSILKKSSENHSALRVIWEMDNNKNEKYNVQIQRQDSSETKEL